MTLIFTPTSLTRYGIRSGYNFSEPASFDGTPFSDVPTSLISWLGTKLANEELVYQVVLENAGQVGETFELQDQVIANDNGSNYTVRVQVPITFRNILTAAVSVIAPLGQRTFSISSESLPSDLRDGLISAWAYISALP